jgi:hypothetical protein
MAAANQHPLLVFLAAPAQPIPDRGQQSDFCYNPETQMPDGWNGVLSHRDIVMSGDRTGDPDTMSYTTDPGSRQADYDTDDSGT